MRIATNRAFVVLPVVGVLTLVIAALAASAAESQPQVQAAGAGKAIVWMHPPAIEKGRCFRELFEQGDRWKDTRAAIDVLGYADHLMNKQFTDEQLGAWLPMLQRWGVKLSLEVGAIKPWGTTGRKVFDIQRPMWDRVQRLGGSIYAIAMDEPLVCTRNDLHQPDDYAVRETAEFIALVRKNYPQVLIGDVEPYPFLSVEDLTKWIEALDKRLGELGVRGLDFFRLDVDWVSFTIASRGSWKDVKKVESFCRARKMPFSLIYWASDWPAMNRLGLADDSTWYVGIMRQGYDYAAVGGSPDQYVIESWIEAPSRCLGETEEFTFTRSVRDFARKFVKRGR
jgi:hypothetical protein